MLNFLSSVIDVWKLLASNTEGYFIYQIKYYNFLIQLVYYYSISKDAKSYLFVLKA